MRYEPFVVFVLLLLVACTYQPQSAPPAQPAAPVAQPAPVITPSVTVSDQQVVNGTVIVKRVVAAVPGWIAIHQMKDNASGPVIGYAPLKEGENADVIVSVPLARVTPTLFAMLHADEPVNDRWEFPGADVPVNVEGKVLNVPFNIIPSTPAVPTPVAQTPPIVAPQVKEFTITATDGGPLPTRIAVAKGDKVRLNFEFFDNYIYYGGLDLKSDVFTIQYRKGETPKKSAEFTADKTFTVRVLWPESGVLKGTLTIEVD